MAYVLGFFTADGSMVKNKREAHFIEFEITDKDLLYRIRELLESNHGVTERKRINNWKNSYRLQIGSKEMFNDLIGLGVTPRKSKTIELPYIPDKYFGHFVRGYFDGDGNIISGYFKKAGRKNKSYIFSTRFTSGSKTFLEGLKNNLTKLVFTTGSVFGSGNTWRLNYSTNDTKKLFKFMYDDLPARLFLQRKYDKFCKGLSILKSDILKVY